MIHKEVDIALREYRRSLESLQGERLRVNRLEDEAWKRFQSVLNSYNPLPFAAYSGNVDIEFMPR